MNTVHNWEIDQDLPTETREHCEGHCRATATRDKRTGLLVSFDARIVKHEGHHEQQ